MVRTRFLGTCAMVAALVLSAVMVAPVAQAASSPVSGTQRCSSSPAGNACASIYTDPTDGYNRYFAVGMVAANPGHGICILGVALYVNGKRQADYDTTKVCSNSLNNYAIVARSTQRFEDYCRIPETPNYTYRTYVTHLTYSQDGATAITIASNPLSNRTCG